MSAETDQIAAEAWARQLHDTYERLAPSFGYETRKETRQFDPTTPSGRLMIAVCGEVVKSAIEKATKELREANDNLFKVARKHSVENQKLRAAQACKK